MSFILRAIAIIALAGHITVLPARGLAQSAYNLPSAGSLVGTSQAYNPAIVTGITIYPNDPLQFDFIIDPGEEDFQGDAIKKEAKKLINYFMATLTVPDDEMWVNLSPYEKDRIIAEGLSKTEMGRDMLAQDYMLKQLTSSMMYPENEFGKEFWDRVYAKAQEKYGTTEIPVNTFNKIWVVPDKAIVYVHDTSVFVIENHLNVMLEEDYLALEANINSTNHGLGNVNRDDMDVISGVSAEVIREVLLPEIEKEVNEGKNFANLRQMYNSMLLATWYKKNLKESLFAQVYANGNKIRGIELDDKGIKEKIFNQYIDAFEKGVYDYIKEDYDFKTQEMIPRKYFSGGLEDYIADEGKERYSEREGQVPENSVGRLDSPHLVVKVKQTMLNAEEISSSPTVSGESAKQQYLDNAVLVQFKAASLPERDKKLIEEMFREILT